jgi:hypothetical protein
MHWTDENSYIIFEKILKGEDHSGEFGVHGRILLKCIFEK